MGINEHRKCEPALLKQGNDTFLLKKGILSTIYREIRRIPEQWIRMVIGKVVKEMGIPSKFAVDSTGIHIYYRSYYYTQRIGELGKIR